MARVLYQAVAQPVPLGNNPETVTESRWHQPWSEPVRFKILPALAVALAAASGNSFSPFPLPNANPTADKYWYRFEEPVRLKPGIGAHLQQTIAFVEAAPFPEQVTESRWHQPWSERLYAKPGLGAHLAPSYQAPVLTPGQEPENVSEDRWHQPWSQRLLPLAGVHASLQQFHTGPVDFGAEVLSPTSWFNWFSEPVRIKRGVGAQLQQFAAIGVPPSLIPENVTEDRWHQPWQIPNDLRKRGLPAQLHPSYQGPVLTPGQEPETVTESRWHQPWSQRLLPLAGVHASLQMFQFPVVIQPLFARQYMKNSIYRTRIIGRNVPTV